MAVSRRQHQSDQDEAARKRYWSELDAAPEPVNRLRTLLTDGNVTLLYSVRDSMHNQAVALKEYLERHPRLTSPPRHPRQTGKQ